MAQQTEVLITPVNNIPRTKTFNALLWHIILALLSILFIFPFLWMVSTSFKEPTDALIWPPKWIPDPFTTENYTRLFVGTTASYLPFVRFFANSAYIAILVVIGRLIVCSAGGFAFARLRFPGRDAAFAMLIGALLLPPVVMIIPLYSFYLAIGWIDTHLPLLIPPVVASTFGTFLFRQFFMTLPKDLDDAARIDGASYWQIFLRIALPLGKPVAAVLAIFTFQESWNNFQTAIIYINTLRKQTLPVGLQAFNQQFGTEYTILMAGSVLALLPILLLFIIFQRYFVQGIQFTGLRG